MGKPENNQVSTLAANGARSADFDPQETREWIQSLEAVVADSGPERGRFLLRQLEEQAQHMGIIDHAQPYSAYRNTIPIDKQRVKGAGFEYFWNAARNT